MIAGPRKHNSPTELAGVCRPPGSTTRASTKVCAWWPEESGRPRTCSGVEYRPVGPASVWPHCCENLTVGKVSSRSSIAWAGIGAAPKTPIDHEEVSRLRDVD